MRVLNDALGKLHQPGKIVLGYDDEQSLYLIGHGGQGTLSIKRVDEGTEELQEFINSKIMSGASLKNSQRNPFMLMSSAKILLFLNIQFSAHFLVLKLSGFNLSVV